MKPLKMTSKFVVLLSLVAFLGCGEKPKKPDTAYGDDVPKMLGATSTEPGAMQGQAAVRLSESPLVQSKPQAEESAKVESKGNTRADEIHKKQTEIILALADAIEAGKSEEEMALLKTQQAELYEELQALDLSPAEMAEVLERHQAEYDKANERLSEATLARAKKVGEDALKDSGQ